MKQCFKLPNMIKKRSLLLLFFLALGVNSIAQTFTEVENNNTIGNALASSQVRKYGPGNFEGTVSSSDSDFWVVSRKSDQATQIKLLVHTNYVGSPLSVDFRVWEYTGGNWGVSGSVVGTLKTSPNPGVFYYEVALNYQNNLNGSGISNNYYALEVFTTSATPINYSIPFNPSTSFPYCYELTVPTVTPTQVNDTDVTLNDLQIDMIDDRYYIVKFSATNSFTDFTDHYIQDQALPTEEATNSYSGSGEHIAYVGTDNGAVQSAMTMTNLQRNTTYYYKVYTYSNCQGYINYNNAGTPVTVTTCPGTTPSAGSVNSVSATSPTTATINTLGRPTGADTSIGYLVKFSDTNSFTPPTSGTTLPTASADYSGQTGEQVVYTGAVGSGAGTTDDINQVITGLQINTNYYVKVYTYDLCGGKYNFETTGSAVATTNYVCAAPLSAVTNINANATGTATMDISSFTPPSNTSQGTLAYVVKVSDTDSFTAPLSVPASSSTAYNTGTGGEQVVYVGSLASPNVSITGLAEITTYYVKVYAYNTCASTDYFETTGSTSVAITTCGTPTGNSELNSFREDLHWEFRLSPIISNVPVGVEGQVVKINTENSFTDITGALNTLPTADVNYSGSGEQVVLAGAFPEGQAFTTQNLLSNTQYFFKIYSYQECAGTYYFSNTSGVISTHTPGVTDKLASNAVINNFTGNAFTLASFTAAAAADNGLGIPKGYIIKMNTTNSFTPHSFRGPIPTPDADYKGGEQVVYFGASTTPNQVITGLTPDTTYYFTIYAYNDSGTPYFFNSYQQVGYEFSIVNNGSLIAPTITFNDVTVNANDANFNLNATSDSSGAINYRIIDNGGTDISLSGTNNATVTIGGKSGTVILEAYQEATATHQSAAKTMTLTINKELSSLGGGIFYQVNSGVTTVDMTSSLTSNSTGAYTFEIIGEALGYSVNGNLLNVNNVAGSIIIKVTQAADANYEETVKYFSTLFFNAGFSPKTTMAHNLFDFSLDMGESRTIETALNFSGVNTTYSIVDDGGTGSTVSGNIFTAGTPGTVTLRAFAPESSLYLASTKDVTIAVTGTLSQTITFNSISAKTYGGANFDLTATSDSGLAITYASSDPSVATISGSTVTIVGNGTTTITASQAGSAIYDPAIDVTQDLMVSKRAIEITADAVSKAYGDTDNLTYQITSGSLAGSDTFTGSLARVTGEDIGTYAINQGTLALTSNYNLSYVGANLSITAKPIEVTVDAGQSKELGAADPIFTYTITNGNLIGSDTFTGVLGRNAGETAGTYPITQGTLALNANYNLSFVSNTFEITKTAASVIINDLVQTYDGIAKPVSVTTNPVGLTVDITYDGATTVPTNAGDYTVVATINDPNYQGSATETLTITKATAIITINDLAQTYDGTTKPVSIVTTPNGLTVDVTYNGGTTVPTDAGSYAVVTTINDANYQGTSSETLTVNKADQAITFGALTGVTYGDVFNVTATSSSGLPVSFASSDASAATISGNEVTVIRVFSVSIIASQAGNSNYNAATNVIQSLSVSRKDLTVRPDVTTIEYGLLADASASTPVIVSGLVNGDTANDLSGTGLANVVYFDGSTTPRDVGNYVNGARINAIGAVPYSSSNYNFLYTFSPIEIVPREVTVTANAGQSKAYGDADPTLVYTVTPLPTTGTSLYNFNTFALSGNLARVAGENVGTYAINQGTLDATTANYNVTFVSNDFEITARAIEITSDAQSKTYGDADPTFTYQITSGTLAGSDTIIGILERTAGENVGTYALTQGTLGINSNYAISFVSSDLTINPRAIEVTAEAKTKIYGDADPTLTYQITNGSLAFSDAFTGALDRASGQAQGNYAINQGTLSLGANYDLTFVPGNLFIDYRFIRVIPAAPISKTYGDADPDLTWPYIITQGSLAFDDTLETYGTFRSPGENIGRYQIRGLSALFTSNNGGESSYSITFTNGGSVSLDITARAIEITADAQSKAYGDADPVLSYQITNGALQFSDTFTGTLSRATGENVGTYAINQGTLSAGRNYIMTYVGNDLAIGQRAIEVTADALNKMYGDADPTLTYQITSGSLAFSDTFTGSLIRVTGENLGNYAINQGTIALNANYNLTYITNNFTIGQRVIEITADAQSKTYGDVDPALTYQITSGSLITGDVFTGTLTRITGENAGNYAIQQGSIDINANYAINYINNDLTINPRTLEITADTKSKVYGDADPALTYQLTAGALQLGDALSGSLSRIAGENVGTYAIQQGSVTAGSNYDLTVVSNDLTIGQRTIEITAEAAGKIFGNVDPALTYQITNGSLAGNDTFTGSLSRVVGEDVGNYTINQGSLSAGNNYALSYVGNTFTIGQASQNITFNALSDVQFGDANFDLNALASSGLTVTYSSSNPAVATVSGNTVTIIGIGTTTITASQAGNGNYAPATDASQLLTVIKGDQTIMFDPLADVLSGSADFNLNATASSGLAVTYTSSNPAVATVSGGTVTIVGVGTTTITASQAGDNNWNIANDVAQVLTVIEGCPIVDLPADNFQIQAASETCTDKNNGIISIQAMQSLDYIATINNQTYSFSSDLLVTDLAPGTYPVCISINGFANCEQCFELVIEEAPMLDGKTTVNGNNTNKQVFVEIETGTAPFTVAINDEVIGEFDTNSFLIDAKNGDKIEVTSSVACEGKLSTTIDLFDQMTVFPNPTTANVTLTLPKFGSSTLTISIHNALGNMVSSKVYSVVGSKVELPMESLPTGIYFVTINQGTSRTFKIIKE